MTVSANNGFRPVRIGPAGETSGCLERLVSRVSTPLLQLNPEHFDAVIATVLRQITEALDVDLSMLAQLADGPDGITSLTCWKRPDAPDIPVGLLRDAPWLLAAATSVGPLEIERFPDGLPPEGLRGAAVPGDRSIKSILIVPITVAGRRTCALSVATLDLFRRWPRAIVETTQVVAGMLAGAVHRRFQEQALEQAANELTRLRGQLESERLYLQEEIATLHDFDEIIGDSPALRSALARVQDVAATDSTVLLLGETGTGKELFARAVHDRSDRRQRPLVRVNCAALPASLIESELFGHERGAFTGAVSTRQGRFELADRGTIFLDEIGDLPMELQAKLLRVLQEGEFERLGSSHMRKVNVRVVAATHCDLGAAVEEGRFRADLYYRLSVFPIRLPPLRERRDDIPRLVWFFIHRRQRSLHRRITHVPDTVMTALRKYAWPGNVRELENVVERAMIRSSSDTLVLDEGLESVARRSAGMPTALDAVERRHIEDVLDRCGWRINGPGNAAEQLALHPNTLRFRMKKLGIVRPPRGNSGACGATRRRR
jgi:transcriptional regulator with GAF, ATPase, and Fis domain